MSLDRICALVRPVQEESRAWLASEDCEGASLSRERYSCPALALFQEEVENFAVKPVGVGRDVPEWLRRLDSEIQRVQQEYLGLGDELERASRVPRVELTPEEWGEELGRLTRPLLPPPSPANWRAPKKGTALEKPPKDAPGPDEPRSGKPGPEKS
jgi:hypothetical protein